MPTIKNKIIINGLKVHDVGYRVFLLNRALTSGLTGFSAFNHTTPDKVQQIEIGIEGDADAIEEFVTGLHDNIPVHAIVDNISIEPYSKRVISILDYMHLAQVEQLDKGIPAILSIQSSQEKMLEKQDQMLDKQDQMLDKQDQMLVKQDQMLVKQDQMLVKQDQMLEIQKQMVDTQKQTNKEIQTLRYDLKTEMNERFNKIEDELKQVKDALHKHGIMA
ncbi:acylphosphatase [Methanospirillum purgamenti]|uniref:acylphosphatase n=1 Tax=Methanospirillum purgamenti TaxID=2834276 RepID=UPI002A23A073|nr:acylphosphatase [Methanospirillum hungatei]MDX8551895.1 acylphosphatase [Methanospirillum hungatei]